MAVIGDGTHMSKLRLLWKSTHGVAITGDIIFCISQF